MFSKTIEYEDFNGTKTAKVFYFHISKAELIEMGVGDMQARIQRIVASNDGVAILRELKELIKMSVGLRSEDGQRFIKDPVAQSELLESPAYDELLMELATSAEKSVEFVKNLLPAKMQEELAAELKKQKDAPDPFKDPEPFSNQQLRGPDWVLEERMPTSQDLRNEPREVVMLAMEMVQKRARGEDTKDSFEKIRALYNK